MISLTRSFLFPVFAIVLIASWASLSADTASAQGANGVGARLDDNLGRGRGGSGPPNAAGPGQQGEGYDEASMGFGYEEGYGEEEMGDDDYSEMMMGGDFYGGNSGPSGVPGRGTSSSPGQASDAIEAYVSTLASAWGGIELGPIFRPQSGGGPEPTGPILRREAEQAFKSGNHALAVELMMGHLAAEYPESLVALQTVKWSGVLRRPVWSYRFGVSMNVRGDGTNDPKPIRAGSSSRFAGGGGRGGMTAGGPGMMAGGPGMGAPGAGGRGEMEAGYGADFGEGYGEEEMGRGGEEMMPGGPGGGMMAASGPGEDPGMGRPGMGGPGMGAPGMGGRGRGRSTQRSMLDESSKETLDKTLGLVAEVVGDEFTKRYQRGDFGSILTSVGGEGAQAGMLGQQLEDLLNSGAQPLPMWQPGIVSLGAADSSEVLAAAREANLDFVFHFDVVIKSSKTATQNISRCRLINVETGKSVGMSKGMDSTEASKLASAGRTDERAYVEDQLSSLLGIIDRQIKLVSIPTGLNGGAVRGRIANLMSGPNARSLRTLAEIRLYQAKQLITDAEVEAAFDIIGGAEGLTLLHGSQKERLEVARNWAAAGASE